jgi:hypothetical protein
MRRLDQITARIIPISTLARQPYARRQFRPVINTLTCLVLVKHDETATQLFVSDDGDAVGAVWIDKTPVLIDPKDRGQFLVVTMTRTLAYQKKLAVCIKDWDRYTPDERVMLKDAVETAKRTRERLTYGNRRPGLHPNATA